MKWTLFFLLIISQTLYAKRFSNQFIEFELPIGWDCALEGSEWVCQSSDDNRKKEAIIILAAKVRGKLDSLEQYKGYLKSNKSYTLPGGRTQVSEPKYTKVSEVNTHRWVDSLHLASEVPGFYTRYMATIKSNLGIAVTFSVSKEHYANYQPVFDRVISSMKVFAQNTYAAGQVKLKDKDENLFKDSTLIGMSKDSVEVNNQKRDGSGSGSGSSNEDLMLFGILALIFGFIVIKKLKK